MNSQDILNLQEAYLSVYEDSYILNYLLEKGYAETPESAYIIMENMSEDWKSNIKGALKTTANVAGRAAAGTADVVGSTARGVVGKKTTSKNPLARASNAASRAASKSVSNSSSVKKLKRFLKYTTLGGFLG